MWILAIRDGVLFLLGVGLIMKELLSVNPDPIALEVGAGLVGAPSLLHHLKIRRISTGSPSEPIRQPSQQESSSTE